LPDPFLKLIFLLMPPRLSPSLTRLRLVRKGPRDLTEKPRSRRPHPNATVAAVRRLIETTPLTYAEIAARTGVGCASICRWTRDAGWQRHLLAPRATDTAPSARASAHMKRRQLAARLLVLTERQVRELEDSACVDAHKLAEALELLKMAKLAARPRRGRRPPGARSAAILKRLSRAEKPRPIIELCEADVCLRVAPRAAIDDFLANRAPPAVKPPQRPRSRRARLYRQDQWRTEEG